MLRELQISLTKNYKPVIFNIPLIFSQCRTFSDLSKKLGNLYKNTENIYFIKTLGFSVSAAWVLWPSSDKFLQNCCSPHHSTPFLSLSISPKYLHCQNCCFPHHSPPFLYLSFSCTYICTVKITAPLPTLRHSFRCLLVLTLGQFYSVLTLS